MKFIVAPDSFKGSISAINTAQAIENGIKKVFSDANVVKLPIADGGEGTVEAMVMSTKGKMIYKDVTGPLGNSVKGYYGILGDKKTAVVEMAAASGITLVSQKELDPLITTTYGTGELIKAALDEGVEKIIIGIGGSATNDGGVGMIQALGGKFLNAEGHELPFGGDALASLANIDLSQIDPRLSKVELLVACDVDNPLCGEKGATAVYGPQKGATPDMVTILDAALAHYANIAAKVTGRDKVSTTAGAGAGGGIGAGLLFFTNAILKPGIDIVLDVIKFKQHVKDANLVITGEGRTDFQTAFGKAPVGVANLAKNYNVQTICIAGCLGDGYEEVYNAGIGALMSIVPKAMTLEECMANGEGLLTDATERACRLLLLGSGIK